MQPMPSFPPARVRDAGRLDAVQRRQQSVDDVRVWAQRGAQSTGEALITGETIGNLLTMGACAYSLRHMDTTDRTLPAVHADRAGIVAPRDTNSKAMRASLRDDEPMVLSTGHEGLSG